MNAPNGPSASTDEFKVAYILHRFPYLTETFIMREMYGLRDHGVDLHIFSLLPPVHNVVHQQAREMESLAHYSPYVSWRVFAALLYFAIRSPLRLLRSIWKTLHQTWREPTMLMRAAILFPKSVFFARQMNEIGIQHIHAHFVWLEGISAGIVKELTDIPFTIHPHAFGLFSRNSRNVRAELRNATRVVTVSKYHKRFIEELCGNKVKIEIVHYGVDTEFFTPAADRASNDPARIVSVGRLVEKKGHEYLVDACAILKQQGIDFRCDIVGGGDPEQRRALESRIDQQDLANEITLLGERGMDEILDLCRNSDMLALACVQARNGDQDGMPNVLIEAMSCGMPVVTTPISGIPELVVDGVNGRLVPPMNAVELASALKELIEREELRHQLGQRARETIIDAFEISKTSGQMADIFRSVAVDAQ